MASIANDPGGRRRIIFIDKAGDRKAIWLGKVSIKLAREIKARVESVNAAAIAGCSIDGETAEWLGKIGDALHDNLASVGLVTRRQAPAQREQVCLGDFLDAFISERADVKPNTRRNLEAAKARLVEHFGRDKSIRDITPGDADSWLLWLDTKYARSTTGRTVKRAKQFFRRALRHKLI